jgi:hypothetical protein
MFCAAVHSRTDDGVARALQFMQVALHIFYVCYAEVQGCHYYMCSVALG